MEFYQTFLDILQGSRVEKTDSKPVDGLRVEIVVDEDESTSVPVNENGEKPTIKQLAHGQFREMALSEHGKTVMMVKALAPSLTNAIRKPQRLLHDDEDYYVAIDCRTNTYYVCYRTLLMIDIDFYKDLATVDVIVDKFKQYVAQKSAEGHPLRFRLFKSRNGVHAFLVSQASSYRDDQTVEMQLELGSDFYYVVYSFIRGWSVRLNKKVADTSDLLYQHICDVGDAISDEDLLKLVDLHIKLVDVFKETGVNKMFGN